MEGDVRFNKKLHKMKGGGSGGVPNSAWELGLWDTFPVQMVLLQKWVGGRRMVIQAEGTAFAGRGCERFKLSSIPSGSQEALPQCLGGEFQDIL